MIEFREDLPLSELQRIVLEYPLITREDIARVLEVDPEQLQQYHEGRVVMPLYLRKKLAHYLQLHADTLLNLIELLEQEDR